MYRQEDRKYTPNSESLQQMGLRKMGRPRALEKGWGWGRPVQEQAGKKDSWEDFQNEAACCPLSSSCCRHCGAWRPSSPERASEVSSLHSFRNENTTQCSGMFSGDLEMPGPVIIEPWPLCHGMGRRVAKPGRTETDGH